ncbi:MAG: PIN domain-containing protein [Akkermansiaceae bacterium]
MPAERFIDTNILLYGYDLDAPEKRAVAKTILEQAWLKPGSAAVSVQVLQEFHVNFTRKGHSVEDSAAVILDFCHWPVIENTLPVFHLGLELQSRWQLSMWDSMILAAAQVSGAAELLTEDLNHGQNYGRVRATNPFL